jgi:predicted nucleic acid-binding protein
MKIVVDSNIVFSAILNTQSKIGQLIINGSRFFDFYTVGLLKEEIIEHKNKILHLTKFSQTQFEDTFQIIVSRISFIDDILLTDDEINKATDLVAEIDENDALFVALNNHLYANLWTGDKRLVNGLKEKGYLRIVSTNDLYDIFIDQLLKSRKKEK